MNSTNREKGQRSAQGKTDESLCSTCQERPAAVVLKQHHGTENSRLFARRTGEQSPRDKPLCLLHYYTTSAVQSDPEDVTVVDQEEFDIQLPGMQAMFAEVFVELQRELAEESASAFAANKNDPLAILTTLASQQQARKRPRPPHKKQEDLNAGGFLRKVPLPDRIVRTQMEQARRQEALTRRMAKASAAAAEASSAGNLTRRRKSSRKSIWNTVMDEAEEQSAAKHSFKSEGAPGKPNPSLNPPSTSDGVICSCGSLKVDSLSTNSARNQDMAKGETWGSKDRTDEVFSRYQCQGCGKIWSEGH